MFFIDYFYCLKKKLIEIYYENVYIIVINVSKI